MVQDGADGGAARAANTAHFRSPLTKSRSFSDSGSRTSSMSASSPRLPEQSKDDIYYLSNPNRRDQRDHRGHQDGGGGGSAGGGGGTTGTTTSTTIRNTREITSSCPAPTPSTPVRFGFPITGLSLQMPPRDFVLPPPAAAAAAAVAALHLPPAAAATAATTITTASSTTATSISAFASAAASASASASASRNIHPRQLPPHQQQQEDEEQLFTAPPLSPRSNNIYPHSYPHVYASPTNILPRRSRGLDFSRAATSLHHSTLADQASPDSSPTTVSSRALHLPGRRGALGEYATSSAEQTSASLWSIMGGVQDHRVQPGLLANGNGMSVASDSSSSSDLDDDLMDEDLDEAIITTPQAARGSLPVGMQPSVNAIGLGGGFPAANNLMSFQQRQRQRKKNKKKLRGPFGVPYYNQAAAPAASAGAPTALDAMSKDLPSSHSRRRESISWAANKLHISGSESDDAKAKADSPSRPGVIRRTVTRRSNLLPKTKGFARIRAALAEEGAPLEAEARHEAEVVKQVLDSDRDLDPRPHALATAMPSPNLPPDPKPDDVMGEDSMMVDDPPGSGLGLLASSSSNNTSFKDQAMRNSKGKVFWDTFSEHSSSARVTPPPPSLAGHRSSSGGMSFSEDVGMETPQSQPAGAGQQQQAGGFMAENGNTKNGNSRGSSISISAATIATAAVATATTGAAPPTNGNPGFPPGLPPTAAEITRRINNKRRRDDDFDPVSFKRRAVSPGMSAQNSPVIQSPLQREATPWGGVVGGSYGGGGASSSRPSSVGADAAATGSTRAGSGSGAPSEAGGSGTPGGGRVGKGRIGYQGMESTNNAVTRLSIE